MGYQKTTESKTTVYYNAVTETQNSNITATQKYSREKTIIHQKASHNRLHQVRSTTNTTVTQESKSRPPPDSKVQVPHKQKTTSDITKHFLHWKHHFSSQQGEVVLCCVGNRQDQERDGASNTRV